MAIECEIRNSLAKEPLIGTHICSDKWFRKKTKEDNLFFKSAIDLGCNNGYGFKKYGKPFVTEKVVFVDFAERCLEEAKKRFGNAIKSDYLKIDLTKGWTGLGTFDLVCLCQVIQHLPNINDANIVFKKACNLLKTNGRMLFSHYGSSKKETIEGRFSNGLFYRRCSVGVLKELITKNKMTVVHSGEAGKDYNFILKK